jgi:hypothetical protein
MNRPFQNKQTLTNQKQINTHQEKLIGKKRKAAAGLKPYLFCCQWFVYILCILCLEINNFLKLLSFLFVNNKSISVIKIVLGKDHDLRKNVKC